MIIENEHPLSQRRRAEGFFRPGFNINAEWVVNVDAIQLIRSKIVGSHTATMPAQFIPLLRQLLSSQHGDVKESNCVFSEDFV